VREAGGRQSGGKDHDAEPREPRLAEAVHHRTEEQGPDEHAHRAEVHDEVADVLLGDVEPSGEEEGHDLDGAVEGADPDRMDPDEARGGVVPVKRHPRDRGPARLSWPARGHVAFGATASCAIENAEMRIPTAVALAPESVA
jgi:hypothetical protein